MQPRTTQFPFLRQALRHPRRVGALAQTSSAAAQRIVAAAGVPDAESLVELGAGAGVITAEILRQKSPTARFLAVERNPEFAHVLRERFPNLDLACACAGDLSAHAAARGLAAVDAVISTLPWTNFPLRSQRQILTTVAELLRPRRGIFLTVVCAGLHATAPGRRFRRELERTFTRVEVSPICWRNLPPVLFYRTRGQGPANAGSTRAATV